MFVCLPICLSIYLSAYPLSHHNQTHSIPIHAIQMILIIIATTSQYDKNTKQKCENPHNYFSSKSNSQDRRMKTTENTKYNIGAS